MRKSATVIAMFAVLVGACAKANHPPPRTAPSAPEQASLDTNEEEDQDGDVDAEDEAPASDAKADATEQGPCPAGTVLVETSEKRFCIDKYEASLVEVAADGS